MTCTPAPRMLQPNWSVSPGPCLATLAWVMYCSVHQTRISEGTSSSAHNEYVSSIFSSGTQLF